MNGLVGQGLSASAELARVVDLLCVLGVLASAIAAWAHLGRRSPAWLAWLPVACLAAAALAQAGHAWLRWGEVNHFPSQTMSEVLNMFCLGLLVSKTALHFALGLARRGGGWAALDKLLIALVLGSVLFTHRYIETLSTAQRDLPPALQSGWFAPHLSSLIFSYATMGIAALAALAYFLARFWSGVFQGGFSRRSQIWILAGLVLLPFVQIVTLPLLALSGALFFVLARLGRLPSTEAMQRLERELDDVSFRAFAVGIPFLTAGLWMGAFWAQEAWANYWGWDSKENSALITWLVYIVYIHLRMLGGYRGAKAMSVLVGGALSVFMTFQLFGYLPDSQKSLHRYTDDNVRPMEGQQSASPQSTEQARAETRPAGNPGR